VNYPLISSIIAAGVWGRCDLPTGGFGGLAPQDKFGFWTKNCHFIGSSIMVNFFLSPLSNF